MLVFQDHPALVGTGRVGEKDLSELPWNRRRTMSMCLHVFADELEQISDNKIRLLVQRIFDALCPYYFWEIPASVKGHHPMICCQKGGLVKHTKLAFRFAKSFMEMWPNEQEGFRDEALAAVLLHDMMKRGYYIDELKTFTDHRQATTAHGKFCASQINMLMEIKGNRCGVPKERIYRIIDAVRNHMGKWTEGFIEGPSTKSHVVSVTTHLADYAASRHLDKWLAEIMLDDSNPM